MATAWIADCISHDDKNGVSDVLEDEYHLLFNVVLFWY